MGCDVQIIPKHLRDKIHKKITKILTIFYSLFQLFIRFFFLFGQHFFKLEKLYNWLFDLKKKKLYTFQHLLQKKKLEVELYFYIFGYV